MIIGKVTWCVKSSVVKKYIQLKTLLLLSDSFLDWEDRIFVKLYLNLLSFGAMHLFICKNFINKKKKDNRNKHSY